MKAARSFKHEEIMVDRLGWDRDLSTEDTARAEDQSPCCNCGHRPSSGWGCICGAAMAWCMLLKIRSVQQIIIRHCIFYPCDSIALRRSRCSPTVLFLLRKPLPSLCVITSNLLNKRCVRNSIPLQFIWKPCLMKPPIPHHGWNAQYNFFFFYFHDRRSVNGR